MPQKPKDNTKADGKDLFQTPHYATRLILPYLEPLDLIWEPACGEGRMVEVLMEQHPVWASDIRLFHPKLQTFEQWDFLKVKPAEWIQENIDVIVTNPPFSLKKKFFEMCWYYWQTSSIPFALLIPADYTGWGIDAARNKDCVKLIPTKRINYISPTGKDERGGHTSRFHSLWLTKGIQNFGGLTEVYLELTNEMKKDI